MEKKKTLFHSRMTMLTARQYSQSCLQKNRQIKPRCILYSTMYSHPSKCSVKHFIHTVYNKYILCKCIHYDNVKEFSLLSNKTEVRVNAHEMDAITNMHTYNEEE